VRLGEVVVVTFGPKETDQSLRSALATGADRAIRVDATDDKLDGDLVARALKTLVEREVPDLVLIGKQAVDGDSNQVGQILAELLDWPMATFAATIKEEPGAVLVGREIDGGVTSLRVRLPAVVTVDLRIVAPGSVYSMKTSPTFKHNDGVRFAALPAIMAAKKKPLVEVKLADLVSDTALKVRYQAFEPPPARSAGIKVPDVEELVLRLRDEAKVL
jgi:electron transfer flavoprotein beta subunit